MIIITFHIIVMFFITVNNFLYVMLFFTYEQNFW